jgi:uncharacterized repeat protein (TIGR04138 family)
MQAVHFDEVLDKIIAADPRYHIDAYHFVREALDHTQARFGKGQTEGIRHVTGQELLEGIRSYGLEQFGPMALTVLDSWGVGRCADFGEIVFNMVEAGLLGKTEQDRREDFQGSYDFFEAFCRPYLPAKPIQAPAAPEAKPTEV